MAQRRASSRIRHGVFRSVCTYMNICPILVVAVCGKAVGITAGQTGNATGRGETVVPRVGKTATRGLVYY